MNRHTKLALMVVPFLIIGGYIASDFYVEHQANEKRVFELKLDGPCDVINEKCILKAQSFEVNVFDKKGVTTVNSTFPLDRAVLFLVDTNNKATLYQLAMTDSPYYWQAPTKLRQFTANKGDRYKLRLILSIKGGQYISEFYSETNK